MTTTFSQSIIKISRKDIGEGVVILPLRDYRAMQERAVPTYYLTGKKAMALDKLVEEGLKEYREGRTRHIKSLADLR